PPTPPTTATLPGALGLASGGSLSGGLDDQPQNLAVADYQAALDALADVDDVNLVVIPDAAALQATERQAVQQAMIDHCLELSDRFAILDSGPALPPFG